MKRELGDAEICGVTYTGGYVMPPGVPGAGQTALPADLEAAAIEQAARMYQLRSSSGVHASKTRVGCIGKWGIGIGCRGSVGC